MTLTWFIIFEFLIYFRLYKMVSKSGSLWLYGLHILSWKLLFLFTFQYVCMIVWYTRSPVCFYFLICKRIWHKIHYFLISLHFLDFHVRYCQKSRKQNISIEKRNWITLALLLIWPSVCNVYVFVTFNLRHAITGSCIFWWVLRLRL